MAVHIHDQSLAEAVQALLKVVRQIEHSNKKAMAVVVVTSDGQRGVSLGDQPVETLTFADLFDGRLAGRDFRGINLFQDPRALLFQQALTGLGQALQGYGRRCFGRSSVAIVRTWAVVPDLERPNGPEACWRLFDGGPVSEDLGDLELLGSVNLNGNSLVGPPTAPRRSA